MDTFHRAIERKLGVVLWIMAITVLAVHADSEHLDRIDLGNPESEAAHNLETRGSTVVAYDEFSEQDPRLTEVKASASEKSKGYVPSNVIDGGAETRWNVSGPDRQWLMFKLNRTVEIDSVSFLKKEGGRRFDFEIEVSNNTSNWKEVYAGKVKASGEFETYNFEEIEAKAVRIVCHGKNWMNIQEFRIGGLEWPEAYQPATYHRALGETGRRLKSRGLIDESKLTDVDWMHGWMTFDVEVDPQEQNYITLKIWGGETSRGTLGLMMPHNSKDEPYRWITTGHKFTMHFPYQYLWNGTAWANTPPAPGRWVYRTYVLPYEQVTEDREKVRLRIQHMDHRVRPSGSFPPTLYSVYTHNDPQFVPPTDAPQGKKFEWGHQKGARDEQELEQKFRKEAKNFVEEVISNKRRGNLLVLDDIYHAEWSDHHKDERLIQWVAETLDARARQFEKRGNLGGRWADSGRKLARPYSNLHDGFEELGILDETIEVADNKEVTRRKAYVRMFKGEFDRYHKKRRKFTNQAYYSCVGLYFLNRALLKLNPEEALSEAEARWFVYEAFGLVPWGPDQNKWSKASMKVGFPERVVTDAGLTRELGFATGYGEMTDQYAKVAEDLGSPELKERVVQMVKARANFRVPGNARESEAGSYSGRLPENWTPGQRILRGIGLFGHRRRPYPAGVVYGHYDALTEAAILKDPISVRLAELYLEHHGEFTGGRRNNPVENYRYYRTFMELPDGNYRLPYEEGHEDYAWSDEENGVFMIRDGDELLYGGFFFGPAPFGRNPIGRIYHRTPKNDRLVDVKLDSRGPESGKFYEISPDERNWRPLKMPEGHVSVLEGMKLPINPLPPGIEQFGVKKWPPREYRKGRAWFYQANYGDLLIGMNTTHKDAYTASLYELDVPEEHRNKIATDLTTGRPVDLSEPVILGPQSTMVLDVASPHTKRTKSHTEPRPDGVR